MDARNRILWVAHPYTILAMANLETTYVEMGNYREAEKLKTQVFHARNRILELEPH